MSKTIKLFLIYILSIISVFGTYTTTAEAHSGNFSGPADRIRNYTNFNYTYGIDGDSYKNSGFHCTPNEVRTDWEGAADFSDVGQGFATFARLFAATQLTVIDTIAVPIICNTIIDAYTKKGIATGSIVSVLIGIFGTAYEQLYNEYIVETDYGLDLWNPMCLPITLTLGASCLTLNLVKRFTNDSKKILATFSAVLGIYATIKNVFEGIQILRAKLIFNDLKVCGDDWYTYGNTELEEIINENATNVLGKNNSIKDEYIRKYYPVKGEFSGSYKYYLGLCISNRDAESCKKLGFNLEDTTQITEKNKIYREYKYGGMEYAYHGCNDPRPEARNYDVNAKLIKFPQLYYATGTNGINFACDRFLDKKEWHNDYKCCVNASKNLLCLEANGIHTFCNKDSDCNVTTSIINSNSENDTKIKDMIEKKKSCEKLYNDYVKNCEENSSSDEEKKSCSNDDEFKKEYLDGCNSFEDSEINFNYVDYENEVENEVHRQIKVKISPSQNVPNKYCFTTKSFCPYDFNILGGTEKIGDKFNDTNECGISKETDIYECKFITNKNCKNDKGDIYDCHNQPSNFCQLDRHCMMLRPWPDVDIESPTYPYIDKSCINNVGSSHNAKNFEPYNSYTRKINIKTHLLTPVIECIVETSKNLLYNKAGFTVCKDESKMPTEDEYCESGYKFKFGEDVTEYGYENFFERTRKSVSKLVKILLTLAVIFYGFNLVVFGKAFKKEDFIAFFFKIFLVITISLNTNWTKFIFDGIYQVSGTIINFSQGILKLEEWKPDYNNVKFDGCYFGSYKNFENNYELYPTGRRYIAFFDYIDCKFQKYMGFDFGSNDIITVILALFFTGIIAFIVMIPLLLIFFVLITTIIKISYIFIVSMLSLTLLLFLTPIFVPMILFNRTKGMFEKWLNQIIGYMFYPLFLIVSVTILFHIYDEFFISEAIYYGTNNAPYRDIYCGRVCKVENEYKMIKHEAKDEEAELACNELGGEFIDLIKYPVCIYKQRGKITDKNVDILSFFTSLRLPFFTISASLYKFLFINHAVLLLILLFIESFLENIIDLGSIIFKVKADASVLKNLTAINLLTKVFNFGGYGGLGKNINTVTNVGNKLALRRLEYEDKIKEKEDKNNNESNLENDNGGNE